jgi:hypothetical protein
MKHLPIRIRAIVAAALMTLALAAFAGPVAASGLTVTLPCGCQPVVDQPVGSAPYAPGIDNNGSSVASFSQ